MSEETVERVRAALAAYARGDLDQALWYTDPEIEFHSAVIGGAEGRVYKGHRGVRQWYADTFEAFEEVRIPVSEIRDLGERIVTLGELKARGRESGVYLESPMAWVFTIRDGKMIRAQGFLSHAEALEAAGLRE